ncbi:MAG: amidase family protein [Myxococcota bacterium]
MSRAGSALDRRRFLALTASLGAAAVAPGCLGTPASARGFSTSELRDLDGVAMAERVRAGDLAPRTLVAHARDAIEALDPALNAVVTKFYDHAFALAERVDRSRPFAGVPYLIKDLSEYAGFRTTFGSRMNANHVSTRTTPIVEAAVDAGLVPLGKTNTPESGQLPTTEPLAYGATRNPWNPAYSAGGSSGGSGAAVAAGMVPLASSSDGGGSIRIPACNCGVFGLKASRGRNIGSNAAPLWFSVKGVISRSVRDTARFLQSTERTDAAAPLPPVGFVAGPGTRRLKIGLIEAGVGRLAPTDEVRDAVLQAAALCRSLGHDVRETDFPESVHAMGDAMMNATAQQIAAMADGVEARLGRAVDEREFEPWTLQILAHARKIDAPTRAASIAHLERLTRDTHALFDRFDLLLMPVLATRAVKIGHLSPKAEFGFEEMLRRNQNYVAYTTVFNISGDPAMSVPLSWTEDGIPIGSQFAARTGDEATLLAMAYEIEQARPWRDRHPPTSIWRG